MAQLAIKGHTTRGSEVIELLEMLGGENLYMGIGTAENILYFIHNNAIQFWHINDLDLSDFIVFTLDEFLEKFPYKIGDKVNSKYLKNHRIEKMGWKDTHNRVTYKLQGVGWFAADELEPYKKETMENKTDTSMAPILRSEDYSGRRFGYKIPKGYEFECIKENEIIIKPIKPQYPKTYEECWYMLKHNINNDKVTGYKNNILSSLQKLLICRDAYWKIAGERMGLGRPWEPNWNNESENKYSIVVHDNPRCYCDCRRACSILTFPTIEMRDAFYENFKELIELVKELL